MKDDQILVEVDAVADAAYIRLSSSPVVRTTAHNDEINIDLDQFSVVVGIEVLHLAAEIPFLALVTDYHVDSRKVELLRLLQPSIATLATTSKASASLRPSTRSQPTHS